jgi:hypothetical protein
MIAASDATWSSACALDHFRAPAALFSTSWIQKNSGWCCIELRPICFSECMSSLRLIPLWMLNVTALMVRRLAAHW